MSKGLDGRASSSRASVEEQGEDGGEGDGCEEVRIAGCGNNAEMKHQDYDVGFRSLFPLLRVLMRLYIITNQLEMRERVLDLAHMEILCRVL